MPGWIGVPDVPVLNFGTGTLFRESGNGVRRNNNHLQGQGRVPRRCPGVTAVPAGRRQEGHCQLHLQHARPQCAASQRGAAYFARLETYAELGAHTKNMTCAPSFVPT